MYSEFIILLTKESMCSTQRLIKYVKTMVVFPIEKEKYIKIIYYFVNPRIYVFYIDLSNVRKPQA